MRPSHLFLALAALALPCAAQVAVAAAEHTTRPVVQDLRVLYAGDPDDARTEDFEKFLAAHFKAVGTTSYSTFSPAAMDDYDVVIFDWGKIFDRENNRLHSPERPALPADFSRPMVLIGAPGIRIAESLGARLDWL